LKFPTGPPAGQPNDTQDHPKPEDLENN
jgi:hypothetical protein